MPFIQDPLDPHTAGIKDWADRQRTKRITKEFQNTTQEDAYDHSHKMHAHHAEMAKHHDELGDFLTEGRDEPHLQYLFRDVHETARDAHGLVINLLQNPHVDSETRWNAINHANDCTRNADQMTEDSRSYLDPHEEEDDDY